jgi:hypothetical protein
MFAVYDKAKPEIENIRGLNLAVLKLTIVHMAKLPLYQNIRKTGMICSVKPVLTEDLCIVQKVEFSVTRHMCEIHT